MEKVADYCRVQVSKEIYKLILYGEEAEFPEVKEPSGSRPAAATMKKFEMDYKRRLEKIESYNKEKSRAFGIIMGQCLGLTKEVVKSDKSFRTLEEDDNVKGLLGLLRDLCFGTDNKRYVRWIQQAQLRRAVTMKQEANESIQRFATNFLEQIKMVEAISGPLVPIRDVIKRVQQSRMVGEGDDAVTVTDTVAVLADEDVIYKARDQFVACLFLAGVDRDRYKDAIDEMNNDFLRHGKEYPTDVSSMVTWLLRRRGKASSKKELRMG